MPKTFKMKAKICVLGDGGVGKTSLIRRFAFDQFDDRYLKTVGTKVTKIPLTIPRTEGFDVEGDVVIFDIMGQRGFRDMVKDTFFIGAQGLLAVFDLTAPPTLEAVPEWISVATEVCGGVPVFLLANKADLGRETAVAEQAIRNVSEAHNAPYFSTSAKTKSGVEEAFNMMAVEILDRAMKEQVARGVEENLYLQVLTALDKRGSVGLSRREFLSSFPSVTYDTLFKELERLERDGLIAMNWLTRDDYRAYLTPEGRAVAKSGESGAIPELNQAVR